MGSLQSPEPAAEPALPGLDEQPSPQWVIMGIEVRTGGVAVLASATLTRAQMRRRFDDVVKDSPLGKLHLREEHNAVLFECNGFTFIYGATYRECMMSLPDVWQPPELGQ